MKPENEYAELQSLELLSSIRRKSWRRPPPRYGGANDWIFPSNRNQGKAPCWPGVVMQKVIRPAALGAGIRKKIGWHTFRHTYSTLLIANGENVKVVQELMRHASSRFTLEIYSQGQLIAKRQAQQRVVQVLFHEESDRRAPVIGES
jgi:integrase